MRQKCNQVKKHGICKVAAKVHGDFANTSVAQPTIHAATPDHTVGRYLHIPNHLWRRLFLLVFWLVFNARHPIGPLIGFVLARNDSHEARFLTLLWFVKNLISDDLLEVRANFHPNFIRQILRILKQIHKQIPSDIALQIHYLGETEDFLLSRKELKQKIEALEAALKKMQDEFIEAENEILDFDETQKQRNEFLKFTQQRRIDKRKPKLKVWSDVAVPRAQRAPTALPAKAGAG